MSENTKIEWATHTFNGWEGCQKVGPGCDNCYAENRNARFAGGVAVNWGPGAPRRRTSEKNWQLPLKWEREAVATGVRPRVFCSSLADVFDNAVDPEWRQDLANLILQTPNLDWLLLTKRIGNAGAMLGEMFLDGPPPNVRIGTTICNQPEADRDIPKLVALGLPNFLSMEPLLGNVAIWRWLKPHCERHPGDLDVDGKCEVCEGRGIFDMPGAEPLQEHEKAPLRKGIDWVIVGGESGPGARPMHPDWARSLRDQCVAAGVPFLFKQWGEWWEVDSDARDDDGNHIAVDPESHEAREMWDAKTDTLLTIDGRQFTPETLPNDTPARLMTRLGKKAAGRLLDGRTWDEVPA